MSFLWDPWKDIRAFPLHGFLPVEGRWLPKLDIQENENEIILHLELPGMIEKDINLSFKAGALEIQGEKTKEKKEDEDKTKYHHQERSYGKFFRRIQLPSVDPKHLKASFQNGVLKVTIPKPEKEKDFSIPISRL